MKNSSMTGVKLALIIILALGAKAAETNPCDNLYTRLLKADGDADTIALALSNPADYTQTGGFCYTEWNTHKTCCDHTKVLSVANKRLEAWKADIISFRSNVQGLADRFNSRLAEIKFRISKFQTWLDTNKENS